MTKVYKKTW